MNSENRVSSHEKRTLELFESGYNCAQSVLLSFCDLTRLDFDVAKMLSTSFGGGVGGMQEICGALSGMFMAAGLLFGYGDPTDADAKAQHYQRIQMFAKQFQDQFGSITCRNLLDIHVAPMVPAPLPHSQEHPCSHFVSYAASLLDEHIALSLANETGYLPNS